MRGMGKGWKKKRRGKSEKRMERRAPTRLGHSLTLTLSHPTRSPQ